MNGIDINDFLDTPISYRTHLKEIVSIKNRLNDYGKRLSDFSEILKAQADIQLTDLEIAQIENEQATTDLEIAVAELEGK